MKNIFLSMGMCALIVVIGGYFMFGRPASSPEANVAAIATVDTPPIVAQPRIPPTGFKEYRNEHYRISLFYPQSMTVEETDETGDVRTIVFSEADGAGFQVFITPYYEDQITPARFKLDIPTGVMLEPTDVTIDGTRATMFFSENPAVGETREVWFIRNKYLYEVATLKELDAALSTIMSSWKFI